MTRTSKTYSSTRLRRGLPILNERAWPANLRVDHIRVPGIGPIGVRVRALDNAVTKALLPLTLPALRILLGLVFIWFGGLKIVGRSPVAALVAQTLPFSNQHLVMLVLGTTELLLGLVLISGVFVRFALLVLAMHLSLIHI